MGSSLTGGVPLKLGYHGFWTKARPIGMDAEASWPIYSLGDALAIGVRAIAPSKLTFALIDFVG